MHMDQKDIRRDQDILAHLGDEYELYQGAVVPPIFMNSLHVTPKEEMDSGTPRPFVYGRISNPTTHLFEQKVAALERAESAMAFASGMAAISSALLACLRAGDHVIAVENAYGPTRNFINDFLGERFGVEHTYVKGCDIAEFEQALRPNTKAIYLESPSSMLFTLQDLRAVAALAKPRGITTIIDNSWATPLLQKPITLGIDMSLHTVSKYMGGHSDLIAGVVSGSEELMRKVQNVREYYGGILGPMEAWLAIRGLRSMGARLKEHARTADLISRRLEAHPKVRVVHYPALKSHPQHALACAQMSGFASPFSFELDCTNAQARDFVKRLQWFNVGPSWGGFESMAVVAGANTDSTLVRIHTGLEDAQTLLEDLESSLALIP